jgi:signal transduction histidine kinase
LFLFLGGFILSEFLVLGWKDYEGKLLFLCFILIFGFLNFNS